MKYSWLWVIFLVFCPFKEGKAQVDTWPDALYSKQLDSLLLKDLMAYFHPKRKADTQILHQKLPHYLAERFFKDTFDDQNTAVYAGDVFLKTENFYLLRYVVTCAVGQKCHSVYFVSIDHNGQMVDKLPYTYELFRGMGLRRLRSRFIDSHQFYESEWTFGMVLPGRDGSQTHQKIKTIYEHLHLTDSGYFAPVTGSKRRDVRQFPFTSERLIKTEELEQHSKEELELMEKEIFADNGYRFPEKKWLKHFQREWWYRPDKREVTLHLIEEINVMLIRQYLD